MVALDKDRTFITFGQTGCDDRSRKFAWGLFCITHFRPRNFKNKSTHLVLHCGSENGPGKIKGDAPDIYGRYGETTVLFTHCIIKILDAGEEQSVSVRHLSNLALFGFRIGAKYHISY